MTGLILMTLGLCLATVEIGKLFAPERAAVATRLRALAALAPSRPGSVQGGSWIDPMVHRLGFIQQVDRRLAQVGVALTPSEFLLTSLMSAMVGGIAGGLALRHPLAAVALAVVGAGVPFFWLEKKRKDRYKEFSRLLPDAIILIVNGLRAGNTFLQAMQLVARQMPDPIADEFDLALREINWGIPTETALLSLQNRIGTVDMELMVSAVLIQRETGGNLSEILSNIHDAIRDRIRLQGEVQAMTAQGQLSGWLISALPIGLGGIFQVVSPGYLQPLFTDPRGQVMLGVAAVMETIGILVTRKIVQIKY